MNGLSGDSVASHGAVVPHTSTSPTIIHYDLLSVLVDFPVSEAT
jgi:hypothetical protein